MSLCCRSFHWVIISDQAWHYYSKTNYLMTVVGRDNQSRWSSKCGSGKFLSDNGMRATSYPRRTCVLAWRYDVVKEPGLRKRRAPLLFAKHLLNWPWNFNVKRPAPPDPGSAPAIRKMVISDGVKSPDLGDLASAAGTNLEFSRATHVSAYYLSTWYNWT
jgi:hypothetical protein